MTNHPDDRGSMTPDLTPDERQSLREWAAAPAPGEDKLDALVTPALRRPRRSPRGRAVFYQLAAGLILFAAGYLAGHAATENDPARSVAKSDVSQQAPAPAPAPGASVVNVPDTAVAPSPAPKVVASGGSQKECQSPQIYQGSDGNFRIETVLCQSGSHATWVVNPRLELAKAPQHQPEEEKQ